MEINYIVYFCNLNIFIHLFFIPNAKFDGKQLTLRKFITRLTGDFTLKIPQKQD